MSQLKGKIIFITGASAGIGKACAEVFAREKSNLILSARRVERLKTLAKKLEKDHGIKVNVSEIGCQEL